MKTPFSTSSPAALIALILLAVFSAFSASAALQLVTYLNPASGSPPNGNGDSWAPVTSPDGRFVLFASTADNLVETGAGAGIPRSIPPVANVYLRDRLNKTTTLVSVNLSGVGGNGDSFPTGISTNGQFALFESAASDLVTNDDNNTNDIFLRDVVNGVTCLVSVATNGTAGNGVSRSSTLTPNGRYVAFVSEASDLTANDTNGIADIFVRDMQSGSTTLASAGAMPSDASSSSEAPEITPDGRFVVFSSTATNLVSGITATGQIYECDLQLGTTTWASTNAQSISGLGTASFCFNQAVSDDGQFVAFEISPASATATDGFILRDNSQTALTDTVCTNAALPAGANADKRSLNMTPNGRFIAYAANSASKSTSVYLWDAATDTNILASGNPTNGITPGANAYWPDVDPTGRYVVFVSTDTNWISNGVAGVFLRDLQAGTTVLISVNTNGGSLPVNSTAVPALSACGGSVAYESPWANLDGRNFENDVFARDLTNSVSELISVHDPNLGSVTPNGPSLLWPGSVSANGRYAAFSSWASNLSPNDTSRCLDVFVRDLATGGTTLVSVATNGFSGGDFSSEPSISGDGRYVAFASAASNLVAGDTNRTTDVFVRDLQTGVTTLVSIDTNGVSGNRFSHLPLISVDGRYVLFFSQAQNLVPGTYANENLFLRDLPAGRTWDLTTAGCLSGAMTPDGRYVAFVGSIGAATNLYVWDSAASVLIYTNTSPALANVSLSPDAHWLVYVAGASLQAQDLIAGTNFLIAAGPFGPRAGLAFSSNGRFLAYAGTNDIYLYDFQSGTNLPVSHNLDSANPANGPSDSPVVSADGRFVAYRSFASDLVAGNSNGVPDVFLFDSLSNSNVLVSAGLSGAAGNNRSFAPEFSGDGQMLLFQSWASDSTANDFNLGSVLLALDIFALASAGPTNQPPAFNAQVAWAASIPFSASPTSPLISWPFAAGLSYSVQYKNDLNDPVWQPLPVPIVFIGNQAWLYDAAPGSGQRFYRVVQGD